MTMAIIIPLEYMLMLAGIFSVFFIIYEQNLKYAWHILGM